MAKRGEVSVVSKAFTRMYRRSGSFFRDFGSNISAPPVRQLTQITDLGSLTCLFGSSRHRYTTKINRCCQTAGPICDVDGPGKCFDSRHRDPVAARGCGVRHHSVGHGVRRGALDVGSGCLSRRHTTEAGASIDTFLGARFFERLF
jgi:hypothetical protein